jgi:tetratricopeptide (TPR) repeat protein
MSDTSAYDLFISYSRRDNLDGRVSDFVTLLREGYGTLTNGGQLSIFFDIRDIKGMDDWRHRILDGIRSSRLLLVFLSPNYLKSEYCAWEFHEYLKHEAARALLGEGIAAIYLVEIPGWRDRDYEQRAPEWVAEIRRRQHFDFRPWFNEGAAVLKDAAVKARLDDVNGQIRERLSRFSRVMDAKGNVDRHNEHFVGRRTELRRLREMVGLGKVGVITAVHGLGGIGKTALATEYAYTFGHEYPGGRWKVACENQTDLRVPLTTLAGARDLEFEFTEEQKRDLELGFERVVRELKGRADSAKPGRVLLLLDNVDQPQLLEPAQIQRLPQCDWLHVIVTTRMGENDLFGSHKDRAFLSVDELAEEDAIALIERYQPEGRFPNDGAREAAQDIVGLLGRFTLAVETAAVFLGQFADDVSCADFRDRLKEEGLTGLEEAAGETSEGVRHGEKRLTATLRPTLERLSEAEKLAMSFAALLPADHVVLPWVRKLVAEKFPYLGTDAQPGHPDPWQSLLLRLYSLRILQATAESNEVHMHRLLQQVFRLHAGARNVQTFEQALLAHVKTRADFLWYGWVKPECRWEITPLEACAWHWIDKGVYEGAYLANQISRPLKSLGSFAEAERLMRRALTVAEQSGGRHHPNVATALNNLALLLHATNQREEVESFFRRALDIDEQNFGADHTNVARDLNGLAQFLHDTGQFDEAELEFRRALGIWEKNLGPEHPDIAKGLNNLACLLRDIDRLAKAEPLFRRALAINEKSFGPDHPEVATNLNNLAGLLQRTNRVADAESLFRRALAINEKSLGPDHPEVATNLNNLAGLLQRTSRVADAESLFRRALAINEKSLGPDHPRVASCLSDLALLLKETDRSREAEPLMRRALEIDEKNYGPEHRNVALRLNILAALFQDANRLAEAEALYRRALAINEKSFGPDHPNVAGVLNNLALLLKHTNRLGEAEGFFRRALSLNENSLGPDHPEVARNLDNLGTLYLDQGRQTEALPLLERALSIREKALPQEHPDVATGLNNLAQLYRAQEDHAEAKALHERALTIREKVFGSEHAAVAESLINLGALNQDEDRYDQAEAFFNRATEILEKALGPEHPNVAISINNLGALHQKQGHYEKAEPLFNRAMEISKKALGPEHPNVAVGLNNLAQLYRAQGQCAKAEPLFRRALHILLGRSGAQESPHLRHVTCNYAAYLENIGHSPDEIRALLDQISQPFGMTLSAVIPAHRPRI